MVAIVKWRYGWVASFQIQKQKAARQKVLIVVNNRFIPLGFETPYYA